jgi:hypothetical protein
MQESTQAGERQCMRDRKKETLWELQKKEEKSDNEHETGSIPKIGYTKIEMGVVRLMK